MTNVVKIDGSGALRSAARSFFFCLLVLLLPLCAAPRSASADDKAEKAEKAEAAKELASSYKKLVADIKAHKKAFDLEGLQADLATAAGLYNEAEDDDEFRGQVIKLVGSMTKGCKDPPLATAMLQTLADIGDLRGAKYVKPYLKQTDTKKASRMLHVGVATAADLPDPSLVGPLLAIVTKSKTFGIVGSAVDSLARFGKCKKLRNKIVDTLLKEMKKSKPGGKPRMRGLAETPADGGTGDSGTSGYLGQGDGSGARWAVLSVRVPSALNDMTGQDVGGADEWLGALSAYKGKYGSLFQDD